MYLLVMALLCNEFEMWTHFMNHTFFVLLLNNAYNINAIHKQQLFKILSTQMCKCFNKFLFHLGSNSMNLACYLRPGI